MYSNREPPLEIRHLPGLKRTEDVGYVTFGTSKPFSTPHRHLSCISSSLLHPHPRHPPPVLFPRHFTPQTAPTTITHIQLFRDYLHYHIKCSKAYMHSRMRHRVAEFQKVLNRAKPEDKEVAAGGGRERKTVS